MMPRPSIDMFFSLQIVARILALDLLPFVQILKDFLYWLA